ncbi:Spermidine/putrescine transport system permease protein PotB [Roseovarius litorisediminis]|uniref:Spermidine/putrescine transport system permease protein PotB n=1 Tax=Roseovarius litorisediminis TaxID=1312363 RepID=A0A1Y5RJE6_9RHOB|nr:ABC transporter permease [Roseovarius litorisediminis]SLN18743.1 Spermidine/putrescine transport system permease protein PotB [Roseovarius litorisediminis]
MSDIADTGPVLAADGTPLKRSLARALRVQKTRALLLIAPLLAFVLISFIWPIGVMLFRSVENEIVENTLPNTVKELATWDGGSQELPPQSAFEALYFDMFAATELKRHTRLGTRLNYEKTGISSLFRQSGRKLDDPGKDYRKALGAVTSDITKSATWLELISGASDAARSAPLVASQRQRLSTLDDRQIKGDLSFSPSADIVQLLPRAAREYTAFALYTELVDGKDVAKTKPWESVYVALAADLSDADVSGYNGPHAQMLRDLVAADVTAPDFRAIFTDIDKDWGALETWRTIQTHSKPYTSGYFLNAIDMQKTPEGAMAQPENKQILVKLFIRTLIMSLIIMGSCALLAYPVAWILANLPARKANILMIFVLLPFWTSLLVRTSAWKVMLQQQGVINDVLVWLGLVDDADRLIMINNQFGTIVAMTHILLPFMILPMYSVMQTINPSYLRAAKSLGATNWTAFWRVYFPQTIPGIGAGAILVFILSIGYYITPEIVGGTKGVFISNRIAYHISSSLNWGLAAALGTILLVVVLVLYWAYDKIVGIDNVKLG